MLLFREKPFGNKLYLTIWRRVAIFNKISWAGMR